MDVNLSVLDLVIVRKAEKNILGMTVPRCLHPKKSWQNLQSFLSISLKR